MHEYICTEKLDNKALELMLLPQIFNLPKVVFQLHDKLKINDYNPLLHTNSVKQLELKYQITKKLSTPLMLMWVYLSVPTLIDMTVLIPPSVVLITGTKLQEIYE